MAAPGSSADVPENDGQKSVSNPSAQVYIEESIFL
jgi:hypothetical protein